MVRRLFGLLVPFLGSAAAIYTATLIFNREQFDYAVALAAPEDLAALKALGLDISLDATERYWLGLGLVAVLFGLVNLLVKPVVRLVTFPIRILTFGLFSLVINAGLLFLVSFLARRPEIDLPFLVRLTPWVVAAAVYIGLAATIFNWLGDKVSGKGVKVVERVKIVEVPAAPAPQVPQYQPRPAAQPVQRNYPPLSPAPRPAPAQPQPSYGPPPQPTTPSPYAPPQPGQYGPPPQPGQYGPPPQPGQYGPPPQPGTYGQPGQSTYGQPGQGSTYGSGNP